MGKYNKLAIALVGAAIAVMNQFFGFDVAMGGEEVVNTIIPLLTAFGVYAVPNQPTGA